MKIVLIGYGKMGKEIEQIALSRGHEVVLIIDLNNPEAFESELFATADVAIEFTIPQVAMENYNKCFAAGIPVVSGTTGWLERIDQVKEACHKGATFFYASNFSLGVNIFFALNRYLSSIMNHYCTYDVAMQETHHIHKLDAPSGTAISLAEDLIQNIARKEKWVGEPPTSCDQLFIASKREAEVPGIHTVTYESPEDIISITHDAKNRKGFALGAVLAAEFSVDKKGFLTMDDLLKI